MAAASASDTADVVLWVVTMTYGRQQWPMGADSDWVKARSKYFGHQDYGMVNDASTRKCFQDPDSGEFGDHIRTMKDGKKATFEMNGWTITLRKDERLDAEELVVPGFHLICAECATRVTTPVNESCLMMGGTPAVVVFLCVACSPTKGHVFASMGESKWAKRVGARCDATAKTRDGALEALMREGRVKEDFTAKMAGLADDFVKATVVAEKAIAALTLLGGNNADTDAGTKRRRTDK